MVVSYTNHSIFYVHNFLLRSLFKVFYKGKHLHLMKFWLSSLLWSSSIFGFHRLPADSENEKILGNTDLGDSFSDFRRLIRKAKYFSIYNSFTCDFCAGLWVTLYYIYKYVKFSFKSKYFDSLFSK